MATLFKAFFARRATGAEQAVEEAALRSDRFRQAREADWRRLDRIVTAMEKGRLRRLADEDILALPTLYRTAISSLAVARETMLDAATLAYLEALAQRAWFQVYGPRSSLAGWLRGFLGGGWSAAVRGILPDLGIALAAMIAGTIAGWLLVSADPAWFHALVPGEMDGPRQPGASADQLRATLFGQDQGNGLAVFSAYLFSNNAQVAILAFALGFAFALPSIMLLVHNMALLGAMLWLFHDAGLAVDFIGWLSVHGTTELFAILLAGGAGIHVGRNMAFPGNRSILTAAAESGQRSALVMAGVVLMLIVAAGLEGFARQMVDETPGRFAIGGFMLAFWLAYFLAFDRRGREDGG